MAKVLHNWKIVEKPLTTCFDIVDAHGEVIASCATKEEADAMFELFVKVVQRSLKEKA